MYLEHTCYHERSYAASAEAMRLAVTEWDVDSDILRRSANLVVVVVGVLKLVVVEVGVLKLVVVEVGV